MAKRRSSQTDKYVPAGAVQYAELTNEPPFINTTPSGRKRRRPSGKRGEGVRYEAKVQKHFQQAFGKEYVSSPWLRFYSADNPDWRYCQPDGLLVNIRAGRITIVEIKLKHTAQAWWQVRHLYEPVLERLFNPEEKLWEFAVCEVVRWFDPATDFPEQLTSLRSIEDAVPGKFGLYIWNGRGS